MADIVPGIEQVKQELLDLYKFVENAVDTFKSIHKPALEEGTIKSVETTEQLLKVTKETEKITNEMLNLIDSLNFRADDETEQIGAIFDNVKSVETELLPEYSLEIEKLAKKYQISDEDLEPLKKKFGKMITYTRDNFKIAKELKNNIEDDYNDIFELMNRMQFQDITAQQIAAAVKNIKLIYEKLSGILESLNIKLDVDTDKMQKLDKSAITTFDGNATIENTEERQRLADELLKEMERKND